MTGPSVHLAHAPEWAAIIPRAYGHTPLYLSTRGADGRDAVLPSFIVRRPLLGTVVASMPFLDGGGPVGDADARRDLVARLMEHARRMGARSVEIRCAAALDIDNEPQLHKVNLVMPIGDDPQSLWQRLDRGVRNQVRKATKSGLTAAREGHDALPAFYRAYVARMHELGSPPHAPAFFRATLDAFDDRARLFIARRNGGPIGGLIALAHGEAVTVPWAACLSEHRALCPNMLLYWEAIRASCADGFRSFDFGRSTRGAGTYHFKRQWGAQEQALFWYAIPLAQVTRRAATAASSGEALTAAWRRLPRPVTSRLGPYLRRYLVQ